MVTAVSGRTYALGLGTVAVGTSAYCIAGLIPELSAHLAIPLPRAWQLVTAFAWTCVVAGPLLASLTQRVDRRRLLVTALLVTAAGNAISTLAPTFGWMVAARIVAALGTAVYTPAALAIAAHLNPPGARARSLAVVFGGLTVALIVGVPLASALAPHIGFRDVFFGLVLLCVVAAATVDVVVPHQDAAAPVSPRERLAGIADPQVRVVLVIAALAATSMFTAYTYLAPLLASTTGAHATVLSLLLAGYGLGAAIGNVVGGRAADRFGPRRPIIAAVIVCATVLAVLPVPAGTVAGAAVSLTLWGCAFWSLNAPLSTWLLSAVTAQPTLVASLLMTAIYLGMGLGGLAGGLVISGPGITWIAPLASVLSLAALAVLGRTHIHARASPPGPEPHTSTPPTPSQP
jgi:predicted MFS family arabinose efflux permease